MLPRANQSQILFLFSFLSHLLFQQHLGHPLARTGSCMAKERNRWHTTLRLLLLLQKRFRGREGRWDVGQESWSEYCRETKRRAKSLSQRTRFEKQRGVCVFCTQLFFSFSTLLLLYLKSLALVD